MGEGGAAGEPSHWKVLTRSPSAPVAGPEPAAAPFFLSPQVRAAFRSRSERASRQSRGRRRLWEQLRAAWGGEVEGAEAELLDREPAREWRFWIPGGARTRGGWSSARTLAARSSGPVALSSLLGDLNPFIPTPPLRLRQDRPVEEGRRRRHGARGLGPRGRRSPSGPPDAGSGDAEARRSRLSPPADQQGARDRGLRAEPARSCESGRT